MKDTIIKAEHLSYTYEDGTVALKDINLELKRGEKIALLGANGSGKSTFFLCLNGIHKPQKGTLYFNNSPYGYSKKDLLELRSKVGIVFQDPDNQLFSAGIVQEISFGLMNLGLDKEEISLRIEEAICDLEITEFRHKPTHFLSGGQKKQVSIADIIVMKPDLIIFDEPAAALDPKHATIVNQMIDKLCEKGITTIISTHDVNHAYEWADTVILFHSGNVLMTGTPEEVFVNKTALKITNLEQPSCLELFLSLRKKGILGPDLPFPRNLSSLEAYIENIEHQPCGLKENRILINEENIGILVVSFGTSINSTREKTIDAIEKDIAATYPKCKQYRAWTSKRIIKKLEERDNNKIFTVKEAMEQMKKDGITHIVIQPTHIINGVENDLMIQDALEFKPEFERIVFGTPLLTTTADNKAVITAVMKEFPQLEEDDALVFMGHGTTHYANSVYAALDYSFKEMGYDNVFLGTVEAYPTIKTIVKLIKEHPAKNIHLAPFMVVAGDHAINDMSSDEDDSWKCVFEGEGYPVSCYLQGLGEYQGIRNIYLDHLRKAFEEL